MIGKDATFVESMARRLTHTERQVVALHYAEELTLDEIALTLDLPAYRIELILEDVRDRTRSALSAWGAQHIA